MKLLLLLLLVALPLPAQSLGRQVADAAIVRWPEGNLNRDHAPQTWQYQEGTLLLGITALWQQTGDERYLTYIQQSLDHVLDPDGRIHGYNPAEFSQDQILMGRQAQLLCDRTGQPRYCNAVEALHAQLEHQPRTASGGYWHKGIYPNQMWLDGLYMSEPFRAAYAVKHGRPNDFDDIAHQILLLDQHARDPRTGLLFHGWDESHTQPWADAKTGLSPAFWARGMGWYAMSLVDTIPFFPANHPARPKLLAVLNHLMHAVVRYQDPATGTWWEVVDAGSRKGNFLESSASAMFTYTLDRGMRLGYLPQTFRPAADKAWKGIGQQFVEHRDGAIQITHIVKGAGLGKGPDNTPYRSGTYDYYVGESVVEDEPKGIGAFLLAASEAEHPQTTHPSR